MTVWRCWGVLRVGEGCVCWARARAVAAEALDTLGLGSVSPEGAKEPLQAGGVWLGGVCLAD